MFLKQKYGGISKYFCELIKNLPPEHQCNLSVLFSDNQHLKDDKKFFRKLYIPIPKKESKIRGHLKKNAYELNKLYSQYQLSSNSYDLFHPTYYDPYFFKNLKKPFVVTVHDLIEFKFKEQYKSDSLIPQMEKIIKKAQRIIAISENTKKDLIEILGIKQEKIDVVYHGFNRPQLKNRVNTLGRYILYVGYRGGYKNFSRLATVFSRLIVKDDDLKLVCVGQPFTKEEITEVKSLGILNKIVVIGADESKLNQLYSHALVFVYPTLYEGFGMSILEAFANDCPVCLGRTSSLPEVAGDAAIYFDPYDIDSMQQSIQSVVYDDLLSKKMTAAGREQLNNFSWKKCGEETSAFYKKALS